MIFIDPLNKLMPSVQRLLWAMAHTVDQLHSRFHGVRVCASLSPARCSVLVYSDDTKLLM